MFDRQPVTRYDAVVVHAGSNNVIPGSTALGVACQYRFLIDAIKNRYPEAVIYLSAMIPKPCESRAEFLIQLINEIACIMAAKRGCIFLPTYKRFRVSGSANLALYSQSDRLHVNGAGLFQLGKFWQEMTDPKRIEALREQTLLRAQKLTAKLVRRGYPPVGV